MEYSHDHFGSSDVYNSFHDEDPEMEETEDGESLDKSESHSSSDDDVSKSVCIGIVRVIMSFSCILNNRINRKYGMMIHLTVK